AHCPRSKLLSATDGFAASRSVVTHKFGAFGPIISCSANTVAKPPWKRHSFMGRHVQRLHTGTPGPIRCGWAERDSSNREPAHRILDQEWHQDLGTARRYGFLGKRGRRRGQFALRSSYFIRPRLWPFLHRLA